MVDFLGKNYTEITIIYTDLLSLSQKIGSKQHNYQQRGQKRRYQQQHSYKILKIQTHNISLTIKATWMPRQKLFSPLINHYFDKQYYAMKISNRILLVLLCLVVSAFSQSGVARCTYHLYEPSTSLSGVTCSDGANGLLNWGYKDVSAMFPYVTSWQDVAWNSPKCGTCFKITHQTNTIYVTVVDQCGKSDKVGTSHFDLSKEAFVALFGQEGIQKGTMEANFELAQPCQCKGNRKRSPSRQNNFIKMIYPLIKN